MQIIRKVIRSSISLISLNKGLCLCIFGDSEAFCKAEAIRTTVVPITPLISTTVVPISGVIGPTVMRIANATGIGYRHDGSVRFSNKLTYALNH